MKIGAIVRCYHYTEYLEKVLRNISWVDNLLVMNFRYPMVVKQEDETPAVCQKLRVEYLTGQALDQQDVFNLGIKTLKDCDYILINDADEFVHRKDYLRMIGDLEEKHYQAAFTTVIDYVNGPHWRLPIRSHKPAMVIDPTCRCTETRCFSYGNGIMYDDIYMHHFGHALQNIGEKIAELWYDKNKIIEMLEGEPERARPPQWLLELLIGDNNDK